MPIGNPTGGAGYAAEFQSSALPWMTSSIAPANPNAQNIVFGMVTRFIAVTNLSAAGGPNLFFGVTERGTTTESNVATVLPGQTLTLEWRIAQMWLCGSGSQCNYSLAAGLTTIPPNNFYRITGSYPDGTNWPGVG